MKLGGCDECEQQCERQCNVCERQMQCMRTAGAMYASSRNCDGCGRQQAAAFINHMVASGKNHFNNYLGSGTSAFPMSETYCEPGRCEGRTLHVHRTSMVNSIDREVHSRFIRTISTIIQAPVAREVTSTAST
jgi:hypothetical protein